MGKVEKISEIAKTDLKKYKDEGAKSSKVFLQKNEKGKSFSEHLEEEQEKYRKPEEPKLNTKLTITQLTQMVNNAKGILVRPNIKPDVKSKEEEKER